MSNQYHRGRSGTGYYIALVLCAVAIGICGTLYYRHNAPAQAGATDLVAAATRDDPDIPAVAVKPEEPVAATQPKASEGMQTAAPLAGEVTVAYSMEALAYNQTTRDWRTHNGQDICAPEGTAVTAAADGTVYTVYNDDAMGTTVVLRHADGYTTKYACLQPQVSVTPGQAVKLGDTIGLVGTTALVETALGPHLHFSVSLDGEPVDPARFLSRE